MDLGAGETEPERIKVSELSKVSSYSKMVALIAVAQKALTILNAILRKSLDRQDSRSRLQPRRDEAACGRNVHRRKVDGRWVSGGFSPTFSKTVNRLNLAGSP